MITEAVIYKLLDLGFTALAAGLEREAIIGRVKEMEQGGAKPEEIVAALTKMRDDAIAAAQATIDKAH